ncbi:Phosphate [Rhizoctonia solani]|uniref:Phosphate n=1 Tax=Rhizoctonia solani TaxID=456999 RepID=A0A8H7I5A8_9AGAM|nr:Phosphate [Rhizoctonia solani]
MMTAVFAMQGFGNFTAALVALLLPSFEVNQRRKTRLDSIDRCGAVDRLGCHSWVHRTLLSANDSETPRFTMDVERNVEQAVQDVNDFLTTGVQDCPGEYRADNAHAILYGVSRGNLILAAGGLIPGYWFTFMFIDSWGRKPIQIMGEAFPTRYRATAHGISAASGKLGAIIAQVIFSILSAHFKDQSTCDHPVPFVRYLMFAFSFFTITGAAATLLIDETKGRTLEEISNEDQDRFILAPDPLEFQSRDTIDRPSESYPLHNRHSYEP